MTINKNFQIWLLKIYVIKLSSKICYDDSWIKPVFSMLNMLKAERLLTVTFNHFIQTLVDSWRIGMFEEHQSCSEIH